ncbi:hypothetical protein TL16_g06688 [Triparma laevis f. inornata]|uniref:Uncharacterized protein n=2 Tax=Triparma laevis TaxID=1534972 RepID=A0A9W7KSG5_9STRA|nr:hypothetical protein TL16_g06688 [Triparma laevis f. inornata]GMI09919.1 hypothetical protein TrLO_g15295 [Triparma laevis f. longispina]
MATSTPPKLPSLPSTVVSTLAPPSIQSFVTLSLTLDGRDKITKVIAYLSRLLAYWYITQGNTEESLRWSGLKTALQMSRKPFRFFKYLNEYLKFKKLVARPTLSEEGGREGEEVVEVKDKNALPLYKKVGMGGKIIGLAGFWAADNISFLTKGSKFIYPKDADKRTVLAKKAYDFGARLYFFGAVCHLMQGLEDVRRALMDLDKSKNSEEEYKSKQLKLTGCMVGLFKALCDVTVFGNNIRLFEKITGKKLNEGMASLAGLGSAMTVIFNNYPRVKV